ncbi:MAG TPA: hypothetical protein VLB68_08605, partial [Pyrinomonadaceae bacterium]|nr:hypothetical protein [Pyrinomonadaceae bacterium]
ILAVVLVCSLALCLIGAAVFGANDKETFVSPPEATVEGFVRAIVAGRYSRATPHLSRRASTRIHEAELRNFANEIKNGTKVLDVRGEPISIIGDVAEAVAIVRTASDERRVAFRLVREEGVWFIDEFPLNDGN